MQVQSTLQLFECCLRRPEIELQYNIFLSFSGYSDSFRPILQLLVSSCKNYYVPIHPGGNFFGPIFFVPRRSSNLTRHFNLFMHVAQELHRALVPLPLQLAQHAAFSARGWSSSLALPTSA